uniref:Hydrolase, alpha/beta fold family protein n=1 Tax=Solanum tuberosum TaxID=4113 RepID=M1DJT3_SOLTU
MKQGRNHYDIDTQVKIIITYTVLHNYLLEYRRSDKIFIVYEHENIVAIDIEQQMTQSNNVDSSSWSYDREIQVERDFGDACISFELYPSNVSKAIFVAATMLTSGQRALDIFSEKTKSNDLTRQSQIFIYANGNDKPPTAIDLDKSLMKDLLFNHSPAKDVCYGPRLWI